MSVPTCVFLHDGCMLWMGCIHKITLRKYTSYVPDKEVNHGGVDSSLWVHGLDITKENFKGNIQ